MTCPDRAHLDLWLDGALTPSEMAAMATHAGGCTSCRALQVARQAEDALWQAALALDTEELAQLARADLAGTWRVASVPATAALWWPALVLLACAGSYLAWLVALPVLQTAIALAGRLGLAGLALGWALARLGETVGAATAAAAAGPLAEPTLLALTVGLGLWLYLARPWETATATRTTSY